MAAPVTTHRQQPVGTRIDEGFRTLLAFAIQPSVALWEKDVQPPGIDGGEPVETTTMFNRTYHTMRPRVLKKMGNVSATVAFDPAVYPKIVSMVNQEGSITVHFSDGSALNFFGYLAKFEPTGMKEGEQPTAKIDVVCTNYDPVNNTEEGPVYVTGAGTGT